MARPRSNKCNPLFIFPLDLCHRESLDMLLQLFPLALYYFCWFIGLSFPGPRLNQIDIFSLPEKQNVIMLNLRQLMLVLFCVMGRHRYLTQDYLVDRWILWNNLWLWPEMLLLRIGDHLRLECAVLWLILELWLPLHLQFVLSRLLPDALSLVYWQAFLVISEATTI